MLIEFEKNCRKKNKTKTKRNKLNNIYIFKKPSSIFCSFTLVIRQQNLYKKQSRQTVVKKSHWTQGNRKKLTCWNCLIKLAQIENTGSKGIFLFRWYLEKKIFFQNQVIHVFPGLYFCCSIVEFAFLLTKEMNWTLNEIIVKPQNFMMIKMVTWLIH